MPTTREQARDYIERATQDGHPCTYGHLGCAAHDRGPCSNELALRFNLLDDEEELEPAGGLPLEMICEACGNERDICSCSEDPEPPAQRYTVTRTGRTWAVVDPAGQVVEGGFFARTAAQECRDTWEQAAGDPLEQLATELAALDDAYAEMDRQAAAAAQLEPGEPEPEDPEQLLRRAALDHRGQP
jgi:hypothetical protein